MKKAPQLRSFIFCEHYSEQKAVGIHCLNSNGFYFGISPKAQLVSNPKRLKRKKLRICEALFFVGIIPNKKP